MEMATCDGCDGCGPACVAGFTVTREEHRAVQDYLAAQPAAEVARVLNQNKVAPWPGDDAGTGATFTFCRYRDRDHDNCFVYPARPTVCRLFGHTPWLPCPIEAVSTVRTVRSLERVPASERRTWEDWESRKETGKKTR
jgi:hypothetical protein